jgi:hypothetical protein
VIRPIAGRRPADIPRIRIAPFFGTAETLRRCGAATRGLCLGIARAGVPVDLPVAQRPGILRSDLDRACPVLVSPGARYRNRRDLHARAADARFVTRPGSDAEGILRTVFETGQTHVGSEPRTVHAQTPLPADMLGLIR